MPPSAGQVLAARVGHEAWPFLPALVTRCHTQCTDRPGKARAEAAKKGLGRKQ